MTTDFLKNFKFSIYGESHGNSIGAIIDHLPANFKIDLSIINELLLKRNPKMSFNTKRQDTPQIIVESGINKENYTTGTPFMFRLLNDDVRSENYTKNTFRMGHADLNSYQRFGDNYPYSGGGPFSGKITAIIVVIGEIARQVLKSFNYNYDIYAQIKEIQGIESKSLNEAKEAEILNLDSSFPVVEKEKQKEMINFLENLKNDSVGCKLEFLIKNLEDNLGELYYGSFESILSHALFGIPGLKGILFGEAEKFLKYTGGEMQEDFEIQNNEIIMKTNINGGINGGITNGYQAINFSCFMKAPSSFIGEQKQIKIENNIKKAFINRVSGRHDKFIGNKAIYPIKGWIHIVILDLLLEKQKFN